jgi:hypothetical protein
MVEVRIFFMRFSIRFCIEIHVFVFILRPANKNFMRQSLMYICGCGVQRIPHCSVHISGIFQEISDDVIIGPWPRRERRNF